MNQVSGTYNLLVEEWVPVLRTNGQPCRVGIRAALTEAGSIRQIAASNPMDNVAILRFLLAVLQWCKPERSEEERREPEDAEGIPGDWLARLDGVRTGFDLLGEDTGFFQDQTAWAEVEQKEKAKKGKSADDEGGGFRPATDLLQELPSGTTVAHFRHTRDARDALCPACCAVGLVRLSAFAPASAHGTHQQKPSGLNGARPVYAIASGGSLLADLAANWPLPSVVAASDAPWWEDPEEPTDKDTIGPQRAFTWQPRRAWLERPRDDQTAGICSACGDKDRLVRRIALLPGWKRPFGKGPWPADPHLLSVHRPATRSKPPGADPVSFPGPAQPASVLARSWRRPYLGVLQRKAAACAPAQMAAVTCAGPAANKALYQDAAALSAPPVPPGVAQDAAETLQRLAGAMGQLRDVLRQSTPNPKRQHPNRMAALDAQSASLEALLREQFDHWLRSATTKEEAGIGHRLVGQLLPVVRAAVEAATPGSPLRRQEALRRARAALGDALKTLSPAPESPDADEAREAEHESTEEFIGKLEDLKEGERSRLRRLAGQPLDETLPGFDLFTGLWWPLRERNPQAPRRETSWLVARLYGAFPVPHVRRDGAARALAQVLGTCERKPREENAQRRFRARFDALLCSPLPALEPHLHWALSVVADAVERRTCTGLDWAQLLDDLSIWDRGGEHRRKRDIRDIWAEDYLNAAEPPEGRS